MFFAIVSRSDGSVGRVEQFPSRPSAVAFAAEFNSYNIPTSRASVWPNQHRTRQFPYLFRD